MRYPLFEVGRSLPMPVGITQNLNNSANCSLIVTIGHPERKL